MNLKEQYKRIGGKQIKEQVEVGKVYDDVSHPPFANEADWKAQWDKKLNEASMDKRFQREWEKNSKVLLNHLKHESKNKKYDRTQSAEIYDFIGIIEDAMMVPAEMAEIVGMQEGKLTEAEMKVGDAEVRSLEKSLSSKNKELLVKAFDQGKIKTSKDLRNWVKRNI